MTLRYNTRQGSGVERRIAPAIAGPHARATRRKDRDVLDDIKDKTGIYKLGFNKYSFLGIALPLLFVIVVGGGVSALILLMD